MAKTQWEKHVEVLNALEGMWCQFAYDLHRADEPKTHDNLIGRYDGGLSALETAFDVLLENGRIEESGLTRHETGNPPGPPSPPDTTRIHRQRG
jgi:hypothetical protein